MLATFKEHKNCVACCNREGLYVHLETQLRELEVCKKALNDYMESKRRAFPRFYFVSSSDLLDILSNGNNPARVQVHMNKCFQVRGAGHGWVGGRKGRGTVGWRMLCARKAAIVSTDAAAKDIATYLS